MMLDYIYIRHVALDHQLVLLKFARKYLLTHPLKEAKQTNKNNNKTQSNWANKNKLFA